MNTAELRDLLYTGGGISEANSPLFTFTKLYQGDALGILSKMEPESVNCCVTSPPYWGLRDYGVSGQLGLEETPEEYVHKLVEVFREVWRVLRKDGTLWLNLGDSYAGSGKGQWEYGKGQKETYIATKDSPQCKIPKLSSGLKPKDLVGIPWRVAFALQADGWYLRSDIIWSKPNPMPESVKDRPTKSHEYIFLLSKSAKYYYDAEVIKEPCIHNGKNTGVGFGHGTDKEKRTRDRIMGPKNATRNKRTVWELPTKSFKEAHFATFPPDLVVPCILAGCPEGGTALDPFAGSGTTLEVATKLNRKSIGIELNPDYCKIIIQRLQTTNIQQTLFKGGI